jgi:D-sedoheptulose 7-phosphate isomerase
MNSVFAIPSYFDELTSTVKQLPLAVLDDIVRALVRAYDRGRTVFLFGNGGSAALASHMACDLGKGTAPENGRRLRVIALTDNIPLITAWANDTCYERIFAEQLGNLIEPGDVALAISGSGNSPNVLAALEWARRTAAFTIGITGYQGGKMKTLCDLCAVVPSENMQIIEDLHVAISHAVFGAVRQEIRDHGKGLAKARAASVAGGS